MCLETSVQATTFDQKSEAEMQRQQAPGKPRSDAGSNIKQLRSDVNMRSGTVEARAHKPESQAGVIEQ